jgi:hypothetical protein
MANGSGLAMGALWASIHNLRIMVNRGLVSPREVDEVASALFEGLQVGDQEEAAILEVDLTPVFAEMREFAKQAWLGDR